MRHTEHLAEILCLRGFLLDVRRGLLLVRQRHVLFPCAAHSLLDVFPLWLGYDYFSPSLIIKILCHFRRSLDFDHNNIDHRKHKLYTNVSNFSYRWRKWKTFYFQLLGRTAALFGYDFYRADTAVAIGTQAGVVCVDVIEWMMGAVAGEPDLFIPHHVRSDGEAAADRSRRVRKIQVGYPCTFTFHMYILCFRKGAKALLVLCPLLGINYVIVIASPSNPIWLKLTFSYYSVIISSTQVRYFSHCLIVIIFF